MGEIRVHDKQFEPYLNAATIADRIKDIAGKLNKDYTGRKPLFIAILNGSFMFCGRSCLRSLPLMLRSVL